MRRVALLAGLWLALPSSSTAADNPPRPPRLPSSPRAFGRVVRPVQPRTSLALETGHLWGRTGQGVEEQQLSFGLVAELGWGGLGAFLEAPVVFDTVTSEGVYGEGTASSRGAGDLRFGLDGLVLALRRWGWAWELGVGCQATAPTSGGRWVQPDAPHLPAPHHQLGPPGWTVAVGTGLAARPNPRAILQLNADLLGHVRDARDGYWLFGAVSLAAGWRPLSWLAPLLLLDCQLEMVGRQSALRQLVFAVPALRLHPTSRIAVDLGVRLPLRRETWEEHRLSIGATISYGLGPERDDAW
jgi:hypothetical protein